MNIDCYLQAEQRMQVQEAPGVSHTFILLSPLLHDSYYFPQVLSQSANILSSKTAKVFDLMHNFFQSYQKTTSILLIMKI